MILSDVRKYVQRYGTVTLGDVALHFDTSADAIRGMLDFWVNKGTIVQLDGNAACNKTCPLACADSSMTMYQFVDAFSSVVTQPSRLVAADQCASSTSRLTAAPRAAERGPSHAPIPAPTMDPAIASPG